ncbi:MAG: rhamnogalacturonan lyase family protein, partial [Candidatus Zipacnadales bacterium]
MQLASVISLLPLTLIVSLACAKDFPLPQARVIQLEIAAPTGDNESAGSLIAADVDTDGMMELLVTAPGYLGVYRTDGKRLWSKPIDIRVGGPSESQGLPGHHGPGVTAGDIDGDGGIEVVFLTQDSTLHVVSGATGDEEWTVAPPVPEGAKRWEQVMVANFRGQGDRDLLLQATNQEGYRTGCYLAAYAAEDLRERKPPLWIRDDFMSCAHNGARLADLDGDGRDEVLGPTILGPDGTLLSKIPLRGHVDSIFVGDVDPSREGLEVVMLEEGGSEGNRVFLTTKSELIFETHYEHQEPQNAALGRFDVARPGLQI